METSQQNYERIKYTEFSIPYMELQKKYKILIQT